MIKRILWFSAGSLVLSTALLVIVSPGMFRAAFAWLLDHPCTPIAGGLATWAIITLLGQKDLQKAIWIELAAIVTLFNREFTVLGMSFISSLWRAL